MSQTIVLGSPVQCNDEQAGFAFLLPCVSGVVLVPSARHLDYVIVHRGFLRGHDQCVPVRDIYFADMEGVQLTINANELKALPELEAKVTGGAYTQHIVSADSVILGKGVSIIDEHKQVLGHLSGVVIDSMALVEHILTDEPAQKTIPVDRIIRCTKECVLVRRVAQTRSWSQLIKPE